MRTRIEFDITPQDLDAFGARCREERMNKECDHASPGELGIFLTQLVGAQRTAHDAQTAHDPGMRGCYWRLDLPTHGTTVFGETPEAAMRAAIAAVLEADDEDEADDEEGESP